MLVLLTPYEDVITKKLPSSQHDLFRSCTLCVARGEGYLEAASYSRQYGMSKLCL